MLVLVLAVAAYAEQVERRQLLFVAGHDGPAGPVQERHGPLGGELARLVDYGQVEHAALEREYPRDRLGRGEPAGRNLQQGPAVPLEQAAYRHDAALARQLAAQLHPLRGGGPWAPAAPPPAAQAARADGPVYGLPYLFGDQPALFLDEGGQVRAPPLVLGHKVAAQQAAAPLDLVEPVAAHLLPHERGPAGALRAGQPPVGVRKGLEHALPRIVGPL